MRSRRLLWMILAAAPGLAWAADPILPQLQAPSARPTYPPLRSFTATTQAEFLAWFNGVGTAGPCLGDEMAVTPSVTIVATLQLRKPCGTQVTPGAGGPPSATTILATTVDIASTPPVTTVTIPVEVVTGDTLYVVIRSTDQTIPEGIRVAPTDASKLWKLSAPCCAATYALDVTQAEVGYYWFRHMELTGPAAGMVALANFEYSAGRAVIANHARHIVLEQTYVHPHPDHGTNKCVVVGGAFMTIKDSYFTDCMLPGHGDANAIWIASYGTGPYLIHNNRIEGLGEQLMLGGDSWFGPADPEGDRFLVPGDVTITRNWFNRPLAWKTDHATYAPQFHLAGTGTMSTAGTAATFSIAQSGLTNRFVRVESGPQAGQSRKVVSGSGTAWVLASAFGASQSSVTWRWNSLDRTSKNCIEAKGGRRVLFEGNVITNCWMGGQSVSGIQITPREGGTTYDWTIRYNRFDEPGIPLGISLFDPGVSPNTRTSKRMAFSHNLLIDVNSVASKSVGIFEQRMMWLGISGPTSDIGEDWQIEHNTIGVGSNTNYLNIAILFECAAWTVPKHKRFSYRNNIVQYGIVGVGWGLQGCATHNTGVLDYWTVNSGPDVRSFTKNIWFAPNAQTDTAAFSGIDGPAGPTNAASNQHVLVNGTQANVGFTNTTTGDYSLATSIEAATVNVSANGLTVTRTSGTWSAAVLTGHGFKVDATGTILTVTAVGSTTLTLASAYPGSPHTSVAGTVLSAFKGWITGVDPGVDWPTLQSKISGVVP